MDSAELKSEDPLNFVSVSYEKKKMLRFTCQQDILLLKQVLASNPYEALKPKLSWEHIAFLMQQHGLQADGRRCRERTQLLLDYLQNREFRTLRKRGTEAEKREKERLLHEVLLLREKSTPSAMSEQSAEKLLQMQQEREVQIKNLQLLGLSNVNGSVPSRTSTPSDDSATGDVDDVVDEPPAKRGCDENQLMQYLLNKNTKDFAVKQEQLAFARHQFEAEMNQKKELMTLERAKLEFEKSKLEFEKTKFELERLEREKRLQLESDERKLLFELLSKAIECTMTQVKK